MSTLSPLSPGESIWAVGTEGGSEWEAEGGGREEEAHTQWQESGNHCYIYNNSLPSLSLTAQTEHTDFRDCVNAGKANKGILTKWDRCSVAVSKATATDGGGQVGQFQVNFTTLLSSQTIKHASFFHYMLIWRAVVIMEVKQGVSVCWTWPPSAGFKESHTLFWAPWTDISRTARVP